MKRTGLLTNENERKRGSDGGEARACAHKISARATPFSMCLFFLLFCLNDSCTFLFLIPLQTHDRMVPLSLRRLCGRPSTCGAVETKIRPRFLRAESHPTTIPKPRLVIVLACDASPAVLAGADGAPADAPSTTPAQR